MVASASGIRAGAAYVEVGADLLPMERRLAEGHARLKRWAAENSGIVPLTRGTEAAALGGKAGGAGGEAADISGKWAQSIARGAGLAVGIHTAIGAASAALAAVKGDWEKVQDSIRSIPLLGSAAGDLANLFDELFLGIRANIAEIKKKAAEELASTEGIRDVGRVGADFTRRAALVGASPVEKEVAGIREQAAKEIQSVKDKAAKVGLPLKSGSVARTIADIRAWESKAVAEAEGGPAAKKASEESAKLSANIARGQEAINQALLEYDKLLATDPRERLRLEVQAMGLTADKAKQLLAWKLEILRVTEEQAEAEDRAAVEAAKGIAIYQEVIDNLNEREKVRKEGQALEASLRTPKERAEADIEEAKRLLEERAIDQETYRRAINKAVEEAAAGMPEAVAQATIGVRGTFSASEAGRMGYGGAGTGMLDLTRKMEEHLKEIAAAAELGVVFTG